MKKCIISFANGNGNYMRGLARLSDSLRYNFDGDFLAFVGEESLGAAKHSENPYAFKVLAFKKAFNAGYKQVLWLDSSCFAVAPLQPIFDEKAENKFIFQDSGHLLGTWTNDKALSYFNISRDEAMDIHMIGNAGFLGLSFDHFDGGEFLAHWENALDAGMFKGAWTNTENSESFDERCLGHRHDMSCSSAILYKMGVLPQMKSGEEWLQYAGPYDKILNETILIKAQGL